jgi:hypothetical protein
MLFTVLGKQKYLRIREPLTNPFGRALFSMRTETPQEWNTHEHESDVAALQAKALADLRHRFQVADETYRRFRSALLATSPTRHAPRVVEWIPTSNN